MITDFQPGDIFLFSNGERQSPVSWANSDFIFIGKNIDLGIGSGKYLYGKGEALEYLNDNKAKKIGNLNFFTRISINEEKEDVSIWGFNKICKH